MDRLNFVKIRFYSNLLMILTSIHHIYGAIVYDTPWRLHILLFSVPVLAFNWITAGKKLTRRLLYSFLLVNLIITTCLIGLFEGVYNHLIKDTLFYAGTSSDLMTTLFPPPTYIMPNNFFFEFTGVLQAITGILLVYHFIKVIRRKLSHSVL